MYNFVQMLINVVMNKQLSKVFASTIACVNQINLRRESGDSLWMQNSVQQILDRRETCSQPQPTAPTTQPVQ